MDNTVSLFDRFNNWIKESIIVKLMSIGILLLLLLIPSVWVQNLINERQERANGVVEEVSQKWSGNQTLTGPILMIPFKRVEEIKEWSNGSSITRRVETKHAAYFLPATLDIQGKVATSELKRGIFNVVVYDSELDFKSAFGDVDFTNWNVPEEQILWAEAELVMGVSDLNGIHENPAIISGTTPWKSRSTSDIDLKGRRFAGPSDTQDSYNGDIRSGLVVALGWKSRADMVKDFDVKLKLKGSKQLYFLPTGQTTSVNLGGDWPSPSFDGNRLPETRNLSNTGFDASWKVLSFNRPFADQWIDASQTMNGSEFGVRLIIPADQYQQSMRTAKYDILIIILAFTALFLVEITRKVRIHPFQYILVGVALTVFYTLLLSISEHWGYTAAYIVAAVATVILLTLYSSSFLRSRALVGLFSALMTTFYVFIFVIIQAEDLSLLIGSIGLFVIIAVVMYFSRNIKWYKDESQPSTIA